jgi:hypothetical protein
MAIRRIQVRRGTATEWTGANPVLAAGEIGFEINTRKYKIGDDVTAWNDLTYGSILPNDANDLFASRIASGVRGFRTVNQVIPSAIETAIMFDGEQVDTDNFHDTVTNSNRFTIPAGKDGLYAVFGQIRWATSTLGSRRSMEILRDRAGSLQRVGSTEQGPAPTSGTIQRLNGGSVIDAIAGDWFEVRVFQDTGGDLSVGGSSAAASGSWTTFSMFRVGALV